MEPIKVKGSKGTINGWAGIEYASWEDHKCPDANHPRSILCRWKTQVEVRTPVEARILLDSANYCGAGGWWDEQHAMHAAIDRIADRLLAAVEERGWKLPDSE